MAASHRKRRANRTKIPPKGTSIQANFPKPAHGGTTTSTLSIWKSIVSGGAWRLCLCLVAATAIVYAPVWHYDFVNYDDPDYVIGNFIVLGGLTWPGVQWAFTTTTMANWHPLTWLSHMLDVELYGMNAGGHHMTSVLFHILNTVLLFGLLRKMTGAIWRSAFVAALFALHPLHVESVAWVSERKDVLSTLFWMLTLWAYVWYAERPGRKRYALVALLLAMSLMSKPMSVTLPFVLLLLDYWPLRRLEIGTGTHETVRSVLWRERGRVVLGLVREKLPLIILVVTSSIVTYVVQKEGGSVTGLEARPLGIRLGNAVVSYVAYLDKMIWPAELAFLYPFPQSLAGWKVFGSLVIVLGISLLVLRNARCHPYLPVGWLWYLGTLVPVIGLIQIGGHSMADRYSYVPLIGVFVMLAWSLPELLGHWPQRRIVLPAIVVIVVAACSISTRAQLPYWKNSTVLMERALDVTIDNFGAHNNLAVVLANEGKMDESLYHFLEAVRIRPYRADMHHNVAVILSRKGQTVDAIQHYLEAVRINPMDPDSHYGLALELNRQGNIEEAARHLEDALQLNPGHQDAQRMLDTMGRQSTRSTPTNQ